MNTEVAPKLCGLPLRNETRVWKSLTVTEPKVEGQRTTSGQWGFELQQSQNFVVASAVCKSCPRPLSGSTPNTSAWHSPIRLIFDQISQLLNVLIGLRLSFQAGGESPACLQARALP